MENGWQKFKEEQPDAAYHWLLFMKMAEFG